MGRCLQLAYANIRTVRDYTQWCFIIFGLVKSQEHSSQAFAFPRDDVDTPGTPFNVLASKSSLLVVYSF